MRVWRHAPQPGQIRPTVDEGFLSIDKQTGWPSSSRPVLGNLSCEARVLPDDSPGTRFRAYEQSGGSRLWAIYPETIVLWTGGYPTGDYLRRGYPTGWYPTGWRQLPSTRCFPSGNALLSCRRLDGGSILLHREVAGSTSHRQRVGLTIKGRTYPHQASPRLISAGSDWQCSGHDTAQKIGPENEESPSCDHHVLYVFASQKGQTICHSFRALLQSQCICHRLFVSISRGDDIATDTDLQRRGPRGYQRH